MQLHRTGLRAYSIALFSQDNGTETMPARTSEVNPPTGKEFVLIATRLPVRRWVDVIPFLRMSSRISGQLKKSDVVRFGVKTDLLHKRFWTISVWSDRVAMRRFVAAEPHATAVKKFAEWAGP